MRSSSPFGHALTNQAFNALLRHARDHRAHFRTVLMPFAHAQGLHPLGQLRHQCVGHIAHSHRHRNGHAALAR